MSRFLKDRLLQLSTAGVLPYNQIESVTFVDAKWTQSVQTPNPVAFTEFPCRESHPLCRLKNPTVISIWLLVGFHPATRSVQSTPADNTRKRVWQYIEKERKKVSW